MDSPQYLYNNLGGIKMKNLSFKPYYKWIVLNTKSMKTCLKIVQKF